jgi:hypothetical protein
MESGWVAGENQGEVLIYSEVWAIALMQAHWACASVHIANPLCGLQIQLSSCSIEAVRASDRCCCSTELISDAMEGKVRFIG